MSRANNQSDLLREQMDSQEKTVTEKLRLPGIETLHQRPKEEIASTLANVIKSRTGIVSFTYVIGSHIEITYDGNPYSQLR